MKNSSKKTFRTQKKHKSVLSTDTLNTNSKVQEIEKVVSESTIGVLAILYETGVVKSVNIKDLMELYNTGGDFSEYKYKYVNFNDPTWQLDYEIYKELQYQNVLKEALQKVKDRKKAKDELTEVEKALKEFDMYDKKPKNTIH